MPDHPITPPPELVEQWTQEWLDSNWIGKETYICTAAVRWGADQELEACLEWMAQRYGEESHAMGLLRAARRPKPPSLKEQALEELESIMDELHEATDSAFTASAFTASAIRRALESLPDDQ